MSIFIEKRKNDQHREDHASTMAFTGSLSCPVNIAQRLLNLLPGDKDSMIQFSCFPVVAYQKRSYFHPSLGISYSTARDLFKEHITPFVDDPSRFSTHCIKSGAASNTGCRSLDGDLLDRHTGWKNNLSKRQSIKYNTSDLLEVSKRLSL